MNMDGDFDADFRTLGLELTNDWKKVKSTYQKLVKKWHPDRYTNSSSERERAEEKLKEINQAYSKLSDFHKKHGRLPFRKKQKVPRPPTKTDDFTAPQSSKQEQTSPANEANTEKVWAREYQPVTKKQPAKSRKILFFTIILVSIFIYWFEDDSNPVSENGAITNNSEIQPEQAFSESENSSIDPKPTTDKYFTYGSTLGEVLYVQGVPTKTAEDIWYYGKSEVRFKNGRVVTWKTDLDTPLKASAIKLLVK